MDGLNYFIVYLWEPMLNVREIVVEPYSFNRYIERLTNKQSIALLDIVKAVDERIAKQIWSINTYKKTKQQNLKDIAKDILQIKFNDTLNLEQLEHISILKALEQTQGIQVDAAKLLGISARVLNYKIKEHNIQLDNLSYNIIK